MKIFAVAAAIVSLAAPSLAMAAPAPSPGPIHAAASTAKKKLPPPAPARLALSRQVFDAYGGAPMFNAAFDALLNGLIKGVKPSDQVMVMAAPYQDRLVKSMHAHMPRLIEVMAVGVARIFDENDLTFVLNYAKQPTNQALMAKFPALMGDLGLEMGWFTRQILLTEPKAAQYLADVKGKEEPSPSWPTPPQANVDAAREALASSPGGEYFLHPEKAWDEAESKAAGGGKTPKPPAAMDARMRTLFPVFINDMLTILANYITPEAWAASKALQASPEYKAMMDKAKAVDPAVGSSMTEDFMAIFKEIGHDVMTPSQTT